MVNTCGIDGREKQKEKIYEEKLRYHKGQNIAQTRNGHSRNKWSVKSFSFIHIALENILSKYRVQFISENYMEIEVSVISLYVTS